MTPRVDITGTLARLVSVEAEKTKVVGVVYGHGGVLGNENTLPPFFRVMLEGSFGKGSYIRAEVWLPVKWNGILVGLGNGGMAGSIGYTNLREYVKLGYTAVHNDLGTSRGRDSGIGNRQVWQDFGWRATHWATVAAKAFIEAMYGRTPDYSYFVGESTGGEQSLSEAQRFPKDYDGIIAGVPANNRLMLHTYFLWNHRHLTRTDGSPLFNKDEAARLTELGVEYFQSLGDGERGDAFITLPYHGDDTVHSFIKFLRREAEFSTEQLSALEAVYNGPINPRTGERIYNGLPIGSERFGGIPSSHSCESPHFYPFKWAFGADYDGRSFDFDRDLDHLREMMSSDMDANSADLSAFKANGGKLLMYSGGCDPTVPYPDAVRYVERVHEAVSDADSFLRYFIVPGKNHSCGGDGINNIGGSIPSLAELLGVMRKWRENGQAPNSLLGMRCVDGEVLLKREVPMYTVGAGKCPPACSDAYLK